MTVDRNECYIDCFQAQPQELITPLQVNVSETGRLLASRYVLETGKRVRAGSADVRLEENRPSAKGWYPEFVWDRSKAIRCSSSCKDDWVSNVER